MKSPAAGAVAIAVAVALAVSGCGAQGGSAAAPETITVNVPASRPARDVIAPVNRGRPRGVPSSAAQARAARARSAHAPADLGAAENPAVAPLAPAADARLTGVAIWLPYWGLSTGVATVLAHTNVIKVVHPFTDEITHSATVVDQSGGQEPAIATELAARGLTVIPTVTETAGMTAFAATLATPARQAALRRALVAIARQPGNAGLDLDFEDMAFGSGNAAVAARVARLYPRFLARLCQTLHALQRSCEVTVMAKNTAGRLDSNGLDTGVYDYASLARVADRVQIMAYDDHVPSGASGPIAPWSWVESVIDYALAEIPAEKMVLGIATYGYDWSSAGAGSSLTATGARALAAGARSAVGWSEPDAEPYFSYRSGKRRHRVTHTVWFEDATAVYDRAVLAADNRLGGIALWAAGDEDPRTWTMLAGLRR